MISKQRRYLSLSNYQKKCNRVSKLKINLLENPMLINPKCFIIENCKKIEERKWNVYEKGKSIQRYLTTHLGLSLDINHCILCIVCIQCPKKRQARIRVTVLYGVEQENIEIGVELSVTWLKDPVVLTHSSNLSK